MDLQCKYLIHGFPDAVATVLVMWMILIKPGKPAMNERKDLFKKTEAYTHIFINKNANTNTTKSLISENIKFFVT